MRAPGTALFTIFSPGLLLALLRASRRYDAVHVHVTRDLVCLGAIAVTPRARLVLQSHGQVRPDTRLRARLVDRLLLIRALRGARGVLALTSAEEEDLRSVAGTGLRLVRIDNGVVVPDDATSARTGPRRVLFLARLHPRKQVLVFAEAARRARDAGLLDLEFRVVGPDGGDLQQLRDFLQRNDLDSTVRYGGAVSQEQAAAELAAAHVFVLPSVAEVYPVTVLQALAAGTAVVLTEQSGLSRRLRDARAAVVVEPLPEPVLDAIRALASDEGARRALADRGIAFAREHLSIGAVVDRLEPVYRAEGPPTMSS